MTSKTLTPTQWEKLRDNLNPYYQIVCDALLHTGLRSDSEFWRFVENPQWYENGKIRLPSIPGIQQARTVNLSKEGCDAVEALIALTRNNNHRKERNSMRDALRRAATGDGKVTRLVNGKPTKVDRSWILDPDGINAEMLRRTLTTWLVTCYPEKKYEILISMGMDEENFSQYIGKVFKRSEIEKMRKHLEGW
jgi:hypothetical protein